MGLRDHVPNRQCSKPTEQLQLWDLSSGELIEHIPWGGDHTGREPCQLYGAQFSKGGTREWIAAGGSGSNEIKIFSCTNKRAVGMLSLPKVARSLQAHATVFNSLYRAYADHIKPGILLFVCSP